MMGVTRARPDQRDLAVIPEPECRQLVSDHCVGRLALVRKGQPLTMPVNYVFDDDCVVFRTDPGAKPATAPFRRVAFEIDGFDPGVRTGWSVLVQGYATEITRHLDPRSEALRRLPVEPFGPGAKAHWIEIRVVTITGRRIGKGKMAPWSWSPGEAGKGRRSFEDATPVPGAGTDPTG